ncbi:unnamed protein product [Pleuronectes platessa]|uniref:RELT-like protein 1 n=1 Tax=Pleuronectes platessa TaxID=8262 RepID=A0A9N7YUU0_PLEPL|nr:unnamed protein product [Pleuronectes platessa]
MAHPTGATPSVDGGGGVGGKPDYIAFVLVPVFFLLGLLGVVICHVLKRKGYRCTTEAPEDDDVFEEKDPEMGEEMNDTLSENNDTVGQIVHYIMKNEANSDALKAMVRDNSIDSDGPPLTPTSPGTPTPPLTPISPGAPPGAAKHTCNHLHTIGGPGGLKNTCSRCSQKKWPLLRKMSARKSEHRRSQYGEVTVLAVGRFRRWRPRAGRRPSPSRGRQTTRTLRNERRKKIQSFPQKREEQHLDTLFKNPKREHPNICSGGT